MVVGLNQQRNRNHTKILLYDAFPNSSTAISSPLPATESDSSFLILGPIFESENGLATLEIERIVVGIVVSIIGWILTGVGHHKQ